MFARLVLPAVLVLALLFAQGTTAVTTQVPDSLVFVRDGDLYRMTVDGSETVRLTATQVKESSPAVSPDRLQIAFGRGRDELWLMNTHGHDQRRLQPARPRSTLGARTGSPSWSSGGRTIFFDRWSQPWNAHCGSIFRIGADGRGLKRVTGRRLTDVGESQSDPAVSPDGRLIANSASDYCDPGWNGRLAIIHASGRGTDDLRKLRSPPGADVEPTWSPDGLRIAFVAWDFLESGRSALYLVNRDGSGLRRITKWTFETGGPAWSPDSRWIAFHKEAGLFMVRPDGSGLQRVRGTTATDASPAWLPRT